jgi:hypothetical protein
MREVMRIANQFEGMGPYLLEARFGEAYLSFGLFSGLAGFDDTDRDAAPASDYKRRQISHPS